MGERVGVWGKPVGGGGGETAFLPDFLPPPPKGFPHSAWHYPAKGKYKLTACQQTKDNKRISSRRSESVAVSAVLAECRSELRIYHFLAFSKKILPAFYVGRIRV